MAFFWQETRRDRLTVRASAMAFNFLLATFPGLLFLFTFMAYIQIDGLAELVVKVLGQVLPRDALQFLEGTVQNMFSERRPDLLAVGFVLAFFFSTNGVNAMIAAFNKQHPGYIKRNFWQVRGASIRLTTYIITLFIGSILLIIGGREVLDWLHLKASMSRSLTLVALSIFRWLVIILLYFFSISLIYHYGPARKQRWQFITPGSTLATILSILATLGFGYFANRFGLYNEIYGSLGALIVFMIWMNINTFVLLVGFELNNSIYMNRLLLDSEETQPKVL
jgi:membrane protein